MVAALTATIIAPARAGPAAEPLVSVAKDTLPSVVLPALLDPNGKPVLTAPEAPGAASEPDNSDTDTVAATDAQAAVKPNGSLAEMVIELRSSDAGSRELECLATGIFFESKGEPLAGQLAVGKVIANRANSGGRFPSSYCGVLFQRGQFSFVHGRGLPNVAHSNRQWQTAVAVAKIVDQGLQSSVAGNALFFHARYVSPGWGMKRVASIGNHIFYR
jgi:spore germination cell wall hydrolase CwlJ-like protein